MSISGPLPLKDRLGALGEAEVAHHAALKDLVAQLRERAEKCDMRRWGTGNPAYYGGLVVAYREAADDLELLLESA